MLSLTLLSLGACVLEEPLPVTACEVGAGSCALLGHVDDPWPETGARLRVYGDLAVVGSDDQVRLFELSCADEPVELQPDDADRFAGLDSALRIGSAALVPQAHGVELVDVSAPRDPRVVDAWEGGHVLHAGGTRFIGLQGRDLVLGEVCGGRFTTTVLGCVDGAGAWNADTCADPGAALLVGDRLVLQVWEEGSATPWLHVYGLGHGEPVLQTSLSLDDGACGLETDGVDVVAMGIGQVRAIDLDTGTVGDPIELPESFPLVRVAGGQVVAAGDALHAWDLATGAALPPIALPGRPTALELVGSDGSLAVLSGPGMPLVTVERTCAP